MYVHIFGYLVNKLEIWWVYLSPIEKKNGRIRFAFVSTYHCQPYDCVLTNVKPKYSAESAYDKSTLLMCQYSKIICTIWE